MPGKVWTKSDSKLTQVAPTGKEIFFACGINQFKNFGQMAEHSILLPYKSLRKLQKSQELVSFGGALYKYFIIANATIGTPIYQI